MEHNTHNPTPEPAIDHDVMVELAAELHRLTTGLKRDLQREAILPSLSELAAMRPLHTMLTKALSAQLAQSATSPSESATAGGTTAFPGYL